MATPKVILILDDDPAIVKGLELRLRLAGYETVCACDGSTALQAAGDRVPDAIIMDRQLGEDDGLHVLQELRQRPETESTPVLMISGQPPTDEELCCTGATAFLAKPFRGHELLALLDRLTRSTASERND